MSGEQSTKVIINDKCPNIAEDPFEQKECFKACLQGNSVNAESFLEIGAVVNARYNKAVHGAIGDGDINFANGMTCAMFAARSGDSTTCQLLIDQYKADLSLKDDAGMTVLGHHAATSADKLNEQLAAYLCSKLPQVKQYRVLTHPTPLSWAAERGFLTVVEQLYERDESAVGVADEQGRTPLSWAAERGHEAVVDFLVERSAEQIGKFDADDRSPISYAAAAGKLPIVQGLVKPLSPETLKEVLRKKSKKHGRMALSFGAESGNFQLVKYLYDLFTGAAFNRDNANRTPLSYAAASGSLEAAEILHSAFKDAVTYSSADRLPLHWAIDNGHFNVVLFLAKQTPPEKVDKETRFKAIVVGVKKGTLEAVKAICEIYRDVIEMTDSNERNVLSYGAERGDRDIVCFLEEFNRRLITRYDNQRRTAISYAAQGSHLDVVKLLHGKSPKSIEISDKSNRMPLSYACEGGHLETAKFLFENYAAAVAVGTKEVKTPLWYANKNGHREIVKLLLDNEQQKKFFEAVGSGDEESVMKLLLGGRVNCEGVDDNKRTALHVAADKGHFKICHMLIETFQVDICAVDANGITALILAAAGGFVKSARLLQESIEMTGNQLKPALSYAAEKGHLAMVKFLFDVQPEAVDCCDVELRAPLHFAIDSGKIDVVKFLFEKSTERLKETLSDDYVEKLSFMAWEANDGSLMRTLSEKYGFIAADSCCDNETKFGDLFVKAIFNRFPIVKKTPNDKFPSLLFRAVETGDSDLFKIICEKYPDAVKMGDSQNRTPLFLAVEKGSIEVAKFLFEKYPDAVKMVDSQNRTPLFVAVEKGSIEVAKFLFEKYPQALAVDDKAGRSVMSIAWKSKNRALVNVLLEVDASAQHTFLNNCYTPNVAVVRRLLNSGTVDLEAGGPNYLQGATALCLAVYRSSLDLCKMLVTEFGANIEAKDTHPSYGHTPLLWAVIYGQQAIVQFLLENKANPNATNVNGQRALQICSTSYPAIQQLLRQYGAN